MKVGSPRPYDKGAVLKVGKLNLFLRGAFARLHPISKLGGNCPRCPPSDAPEDLPYKMNKIYVKELNQKQILLY